MKIRQYTYLGKELRIFAQLLHGKTALDYGNIRTRAAQPSAHMTEHNSNAPDRGLIWERVKNAALEHHQLTYDRGINKLIALDADVSAQYVSDWKSGRSPIPMATITRLAAKYQRSSAYLAGISDDPSPRTPSERADMVRLVEDVLRRLNPSASPFLTVELCDMALGMLQDGESENAILGALYKRVSDTLQD
ncbi:hypothetical protein QC589_01625 [Halomonas elongata]|uniref:hypothetical protein n=1 Tax=Halomonas elongata TaxID=2746 RepID=UPI00334AD000